MKCSTDVRRILISAGADDPAALAVRIGALAQELQSRLQNEIALKLAGSKLKFIARAPHVGAGSRQHVFLRSCVISGLARQLRPPNVAVLVKLTHGCCMCHEYMTHGQRGCDDFPSMSTPLTWHGCPLDSSGCYERPVDRLIFLCRERAMHTCPAPDLGPKQTPLEQPCPDSPRAAATRQPGSLALQ